jgi:hypothetical protein
MIDVQLFTQSHEKTILIFDNNVLEYFYGTLNGETKRYHVGQIKTIEITTDKNGKHTLVMATKFHTRKEEVADKALGKAKELVVEVQRAIQSTTFVLDHIP